MGKVFTTIFDPLGFSQKREPAQIVQPPEDEKAKKDPVNPDNFDAAEAQRRAEARRKRVTAQSQLPRSGISIRKDSPDNTNLSVRLGK